MLQCFLTLAATAAVSHGSQQQHEVRQASITSSSSSSSSSSSGSRNRQLDNPFAVAQPACSWAVSGATFDLSSLQVTSLTSKSYIIETTSEEEEDYSYIFNICGPVTPASIPYQCSGYMGAVLQYKSGSPWCWVAGTYQQSLPTTFALIEDSDPAKGVSITYADGESCTSAGTGGVARQATVDIYCGNSEARMIKAEEPRSCSYHVVMESMYGCPQECEITADGLCSSNGKCTTDPNTGAPYCQCDEGFSESDCSAGEAVVHDGEDNDMWNSIPYMVTATTNTSKWQGRLLILLSGMVIMLSLGLFYVSCKKHRNNNNYLAVAESDDGHSMGMSGGGLGGGGYENIVSGKEVRENYYKS